MLEQLSIYKKKKKKKFYNIFHLDVHYVCMLVQRFEPQGRRFTNFYYYYYYYWPLVIQCSHDYGDSVRGSGVILHLSIFFWYNRLETDSLFTVNRSAPANSLVAPLVFATQLLWFGSLAVDPKFGMNWLTALRLLSDTALQPFLQFFRTILLYVHRSEVAY